MSTSPFPLRDLDPLATAFRFGQEVYKASLITMINARRLQNGAPPVGWPAVAATPADPIWGRGPTRLLRYRAPGANASHDGARASRDASGPPLLLVCSLINRPYVLDLLPERSVVRRLLDGGLDVWLLDWGAPGPDDRHLGLADYALDRLPAAAREVLRVTGRDTLHVLGYCMGGTFALASIAAGRLPAASLTALATPVDFHDPGLLSTWCRTPGFDGAALAEAFGNVPPHLLQPAFRMLDPVSIATKLRHLDKKIGDDEFLRFFLAMETWLEDSVSFPGGAFRDWVSIYRDNSLARGTLRLGGAAIDLRRVRCPILNIVADGDYITPPASSLALARLAGSTDQETVRLPGGHIGLSTGRAAHEQLWPRVAAWVSARDRAAAPGSGRIKKTDRQGVAPAAARASGGARIKKPTATRAARPTRVAVASATPRRRKPA